MKILVTGGAGFIGSHLVDRLLQTGHKVRILDNLEEPTHPGGRIPDYLNRDADFIKGDIRSFPDLEKAVNGVEVIFHLAATGGFTPDISRYFEVNSVGTSRLMEVIGRNKTDIAKILVASSMGVYGEGLYECPHHGRLHPPVRPDANLSAGAWEHNCPDCGLELFPVAISEDVDVQPARAYSISKFDQERIVLTSAADMGIPAVAMRYFLTYGPRQSPANPYTGICALFLSRLLQGQEPLVYEDGLQTRDMIFVEDLVDAHLLLLDSDLLHQVYNIGSGRSVKILDVVNLLTEIVKRDVHPDIPGLYRPGETRHISADMTRLNELGFNAGNPLEKGLEKLTQWFLELRPATGDQLQALSLLRSNHLVRNSRSRTDL